MSVEEMLGIDLNDPVQKLAHDLVEDDNELFDRLIEVREKWGVTQEQVAFQMGVSKEAVAELESQRDPRLSTLRRYTLAIYMCLGE